MVGRWWLLGLLGALPARAEPVRLVDVSTPSSNVHTGPMGLTAMEGYALFFGEDSLGLYRTDGTPEGTKLLRTLAWRYEPLGPDNSGWRSPPRLAVLGSRAWWRGTEGLWTTDGTPEGTRLVGSLGLAELPTAPVSFGGALYFSAGSRLYRSDGTVEGTRELAGLAVKDLGVTTAVEVGGQLFFSCASEASGLELCRTDGTSAGTAVVADLVPGASGGAPRLLGAVAGRVLFSASAGTASSPRRLYASDGTAAGTVLLHASASLGDDGVEVPLGVQGLAQSPTLLDGAAYFPCASAATGEELCRTEGTAESTTILDLHPGTASTSPRKPGVLAGKLVFQACSSLGAGNGLACRLWSSDGTVSGSEIVWGAQPFPGIEMRAGLAAVGNSLVFYGQSAGRPSALWKTDGTRDGTGELLQLASVEQFVISDLRRDALVFGDKLLFPGSDGQRGLELHATDGTQQGTNLVTDPTPKRGTGRVIDMVSLDERLYVTAHLLVDQRLMRLDGTTSPKNLHFATNSLNNWIEMAPFQGQVLLSTASGLWATDDSATGIHHVTRDVSSTRIIPGGDKAFLTVGGQLWRTDATQSGTWRISDAPASVSEPSYLHGSLWFSGKTQDGRLEPWTTTGELGFTRKLKDIHVATGEGGSAPREFTALGALTFFSAKDEAGRELWKSDGTTSGTVRVADLRPGETGASPEQLFAWKDHLYFWATATEGATTLWKTDGTEAGTVSLRAATLRRPAMSTGFDDASFVAWGDHLFFGGADAEGGRELWRTDGTEEGTVRVADLMPGVDSSHPNALLLASSEGPLVFTALGPATGRELWRLDSPTGAPTLLAEMIPGPRGSNPSHPTMVGSTLYFQADYGQGMTVYKLAGLIPDTFPPRVSCPPNQSTQATSTRGAEVSFEQATAYDDSGEALTLDSSHASGATFPVGTTEVTFTATDSPSNEGTCSFSVTVTSQPDAGPSTPDAGGPPPTEPPADDSGCGCQSGASSLPWAMALFGLLGLSRRHSRVTPR
ncbi:HYR domain-containing protein [Myxococcus sp. K38C18041901]|uniref:HYR domain-containing protein n=1 Tax=Myxococcus guangdongensis TaxID=2906760 RepID=UPI0020A80C42|nr:HYR domain-containing protein [Myxococcus guangdongensis]MCP3061694.1 HYR domain-containing protein [Myxococcus guangdongensis]